MILVDNKLQIAKLRLAYIVTLAVGAIFILFGVFSNNIGTEKMMSGIVGIILILVFIYLLVIKPEYIYIAVEKNTKIVFRNYGAFPLFRKYKAFEIPISALHDFEITSSLLGLRSFIGIMVKSKDKIGRYPLLSLTAASKKEIKIIIDTLNKLLPAEKRKKMN